MKTTDFNRKLSSSRIQENLAKQFDTRVDLDKYDREQLEDIRNKLRTRVFQQEGDAGINDLLTNETYQKDKAMLELLNTRIKEMLGEDIKKLRDKMDQLSEAKKVDQDGNGKKDFDDVQIARMTAGGVPKKKAIARAKSDNFKEDSDDTNKKYRKPKETSHEITLPSGAKAKARKVQGWQSQAADKAAEKDMKEDSDDTNKKYRKPKETSHEITLPSGAKAKARKVQGWQSQAADKAAEKDMKEGKCSECGMWESKCKCSVTERDMGKHNNKTTGFKALAKKAGGGEKGKLIAGAQFQKMKKAGQLESVFKQNVRMVNEAIGYLLNEDEEGKAKAITAAGDIVNDFTNWMQRVGQYQTKALIELHDDIRAEFGHAEAEQFKQIVAPSLATTLETLTAQRETISNAVAQLAGEADAMVPMGSEPGMEPGVEPGMELTAPDQMNPEMGDEFGASDAASGGSEAAGREMRESREDRRARKLAESHSIISKLAK